MRIEVSGLVVRYGEQAVLDGVELSVPEGGLHVILGGSGTGKSVLLRCLNGLERPAAGSVRVGEREVTKLSAGELGELRLDVGYVFQYSALFDSMSVFDNVAWAAREHRGLRGEALREEAQRCLTRVGLEELVESMDRMAPSALSGGRRKRVALARAMAMAPRVLLHDEPTSGLDPASARAIGTLIADLNRAEGITTVVVTHDLDLAAKLAHRISLLARGRFVFEGNAGELRDRTGDADVRRYLEGGD
ncbi:MAG: ATP-binding cassette domain-containing protein [Candidatus Wallbacteria bacterium]|nr:ATP-binding cassette domain-containing protein [Candidatus Wallbacteria bacterium]